MTLGQQANVSSSWSKDDNIAFENALAIYTDENRWEKIAMVVPGKTPEQIIEHYEMLVRDVMMIESGCVPLPDYDSSEELNHNASDEDKSIRECGNSHQQCEFNQKGKSKLKEKRRKGIAWTANEHRQFLLGLEEYGKGDWRSISRYYVVTRTPTQVASHAQKYFARLNSKEENKKRSSIHDVTNAESINNSTIQRPITWGNQNINIAATSNNQAVQTTSQPSLSLPRYGTPNIWNMPATSQPSLDHPTYSASTIWNTPTILQSSAKISTYVLPNMDHTDVGQRLSPFGNNMNFLAPSYMNYEVQHNPVPYSPLPSAPINIGSIPYNNYIPKFPR